MLIPTAVKKLHKLHQEHLLKQIQACNIEEQNVLSQEILGIDEQLFIEQQKCLKHPSHLNVGSFEPFEDYIEAGNHVLFEKGGQVVREGCVGCLIVAGGQGTRLGMPENVSKGIFPISVVKKKSFFQLFAEKAKAVSKWAQRPLPIAIMTSPLNHSSVVSFFQEHHYFGLEESQISFFCQEMLPFLNDEGNLFLESPLHIAKGPNGNGLALLYFYKSGIWQKWQKMGITQLSFIQVDNALADPFDFELLGFHEEQKNEITVKCAKRADEHAKVGLLVKQEGHCKVIEYLEFPSDKWSERNADGSLAYICANLSLFCFSMDFIEKAAKQYAASMPFHFVKKWISIFEDKDGRLVAIKKEAWKFEKFIFDIMPFAKKVGVMLYPRERSFAPLKNSEGLDSIETVHELLQKSDAYIFSKITGKEPPLRSFELAQEFYYPTKELSQKWKGRELPLTDYIEETTL